MATQPNGISALQLQSELALGSYKTAWLLCAKLRHAMVAPGRGPLSGLVEVDKTEIMCRSKNDPTTGGGSSRHGKMLVVGAVEVQDLRTGRIRLTTLPEDSAASLHTFLVANLAPLTSAQTSGEAGYRGAPGINHDPRLTGALDPLTGSIGIRLGAPNGDGPPQNSATTVLIRNYRVRVLTR
jgi:hypothetical protein